MKYYSSRLCPTPAEPALNRRRERLLIAVSAAPIGTPKKSFLPGDDSLTMQPPPGKRQLPHPVLILSSINLTSYVLSPLLITTSATTWCTTHDNADTLQSKQTSTPKNVSIHSLCADFDYKLELAMKPRVHNFKGVATRGASRSKTLACRLACASVLAHA